MNTIEMIERQKQCNNLIELLKSYQTRKRINIIAPLAVDIACIGVSVASIVQASTPPVIPVANLGVVTASAAIESHNSSKLNEEYAELTKQFQNLTGIEFETVGVKWLCDKTYRFYKSMVIKDYIASNKMGNGYTVDMVNNFTSIAREWMLREIIKDGITRNDLIRTSITILRELGNSTLPTETFAHIYKSKYDKLILSSDMVSDYSGAYKLSNDKRFLNKIGKAMKNSVANISAENENTHLVNSNNILQLNEKQLEQYNNSDTSMEL